MPAGFNSENSFPYDDRGADVESDDRLWDLLNVYIDGEATADESALVERMLRTDPAYARSFEILKLTADTVSGIPDVEPPSALRDAIFARTTGRESGFSRVLAAFAGFRQSFTSQYGRYLVPAGGFAAAGLAGLLLWASHRPVTTNGVHADAPTVAAIGNHPGARVGPGNPRVATVEAPSSSAPVTHPTVHANTPKSTERVADVHGSRSTTEGYHLSNARFVVNSVRSASSGQASGTRHKSVLSNSSGTRIADNTTSNVQSYSAQMDDAVKHPADTPQTTAASDLGPAVDSTDDASTVAKTSAPVATAHVPPAGVEVAMNTQSSKPIVHYAALPPEARQVIDGATLRRNKDAQWGGYDRGTVESIQRHELTVSVIHSSF